MTTVATAAPIANRRAGFDLTMPVLLLFAAVLCLLVVMPLGWLVVYAFTDKTGAFTLANFPRLVTDAAYLDPLLTTFALATLVGDHLLRGGGADGLAGGAHRHAAAPHGAAAGHRLVRDAAVHRRHRLGIAGGAQQRPAQSALPRFHRRERRRAFPQHLLVPRPGLRHQLLHVPLCLRAGRQCARPHAGRSRGRLRHSRRQAPWYTARRITIPLALPALVAGALVAFLRSHDAIRHAGDSGHAGGLPHHDHQDLEPVPVPGQARARRRRLAASADPHRHPAARPAHGARPPRLRGGRRQEQRAAPRAPRRLQMAGAGLEHAGADVPGVPAVFRAAQCQLLQARLAHRQRQ